MKAKGIARNFSNPKAWTSSWLKLGLTHGMKNEKPHLTTYYTAPCFVWNLVIISFEVLELTTGDIFLYLTENSALFPNFVPYFILFTGEKPEGKVLMSQLWPSLLFPRDKATNLTEAIQSHLLLIPNLKLEKKEFPIFSLSGFNIVAESNFMTKSLKCTQLPKNWEENWIWI